MRKRILIFNKKADECDVEIKDTDNPAIRKFEFDSVDKKGKPVKIPTVIPETTEEKRRFEAAKQRREHRIAQASKK